MPDDQPNVALAMAILAVAALALLGAGWIAIGGRRPGEEDAVANAESTGGDPRVAAVAAVERRVMRRARLRAADDPILAALGLDEPEPAAEPELEGRLPRSSQRIKGKR